MIEKPEISADRGPLTDWLDQMGLSRATLQDVQSAVEAAAGAASGALRNLPGLVVQQPDGKDRPDKDARKPDRSNESIRTLGGEVSSESATFRDRLLKSGINPDKM